MSVLECFDAPAGGVEATHGSHALEKKGEFVKRGTHAGKVQVVVHVSQGNERVEEVTAQQSRLHELREQHMFTRAHCIWANRISLLVSTNNKTSIVHLKRVQDGQGH